MILHQPETFHCVQCGDTRQICRGGTSREDRHWLQLFSPRLNRSFPGFSRVYVTFQCGWRGLQNQNIKHYLEDADEGIRRYLPKSMLISPYSGSFNMRVQGDPILNSTAKSTENSCSLVLISRDKVWLMSWRNLLPALTICLKSKDYIFLVSL